jgi:hypothetical protein
MSANGFRARACPTARTRKSLKHAAARLCFVGLGKLHANDAASAPRNGAAANRRIKKGKEDRHNNLIVAIYTVMLFEKRKIFSASDAIPLLAEMVTRFSRLGGD